MVSSMTEHFYVKEYIMVSKFCTAEKIIPKLKFLSKNNIFGIYLKFSDFFNFLKNKFPGMKAMIIIKIENDAELEMIMKALKEKV